RLGARDDVREAVGVHVADLDAPNFAARRIDVESGRVGEVPATVAPPHFDLARVGRGLRSDRDVEEPVAVQVADGEPARFAGARVVVVLVVWRARRGRGSNLAGGLAGVSECLVLPDLDAT